LEGDGDASPQLGAVPISTKANAFWKQAPETHLQQFL